MKKRPYNLIVAIIIACLLFPGGRAIAQTSVKTIITLATPVELAPMSIPTIGWNGYKAPFTSYPLKIASADTLFFANSAQRDFVKNGFVNGGITSVTKVLVALPSRIITRLKQYSKYGGRYYNYYYYCNGIDKGYFNVNGLTTKTNTTFTTSYNAAEKLYFVNRQYNTTNSSEALSTYQTLMTSLATDLTGFNGTEYFDQPLLNIGYFYFFLSRPVILKTVAIMAAGPTTFTSGGSVTLSSTAPSLNTWYNGGVLIPTATGTTYMATTSGTYTAKTSAAGYSTASSNAIVVTVNAPVTVAPVLSAAGPTTFSAGGSVVLTSTASTNKWYNGGTLITTAAGNTYTATTSGLYTVIATAPGFNTSASNAIQVTVNPVAAMSPLTVSNNQLINHNGVPVIIHGVNTASYKSGYADDLAAVSNAIKTNSKVNSVRLIWESTQFVTAQGNPPPYFTLPNLNTELQTYTNLHLLPVLTLYDLTVHFDNTVASFNSDVVTFWTDPNLIAILKTYQNNLIINLQNEWGSTYSGMTGATFVSTYQALIVKLRGLGINCPIMIDAPNGGTNSDFMIANGAALIAADPIHNVILSVHTYWSQQNGLIVTCPTDYTTKVKAMATSGLPFMLGEVSDWAVSNSGTDVPSTPLVNFVCPGSGSANGYAVDYDAILTEACNDGIGYYAWSWYQDGNMVRNIYDQQTALTINTSPNAGAFPADMMLNGKVYGLTNASIVPVW